MTFHGYEGGHIITSLGADAQNAIGLVYIAAFALNEGETLGGLAEQGPPAPALVHSTTRSAKYASVTGAAGWPSAFALCGMSARRALISLLLFIKLIWRQVTLRRGLLWRSR